ncbi:ABC transporter ATP-binding protein [Enterococcus sp. MJM12]|uniref:ABC transporter ATP-binding protein n=1 Tax=Candidatus Enterococcus myersii TaxID=2815322 RepID=A0ABS3H6K6_9ENTE|nr:ABC transporter ATP-binding protein [Enterococcus sp. SMC-9]MBO0449094.1 ABC transporter ATP-binding protein [Enterococcus sp. MJM12]MCD1025447.1 ABC transporter ATP-binding protein [Enterococcus sp. SMC-9]
MSYLSIQNISKLYPHKKTKALQDFSLDVAKGEFIAIVGPSGSGKSTLLNILTGFEEPSSGQITLADQEITKLAPKDRDMALVFQEYALFPHMTVAENITFGMKIRKTAKKERQEKLDWVTKELGLTEVVNVLPKNLSGGQRQRVSLARAIVRNPKLFLMDEPLSNLDAKLQDQVGDLILATHKKLQATTLFVTHSQEEAMSLADRIIVLKDGLIQQVGTPHEVYEKPQNRFVAEFIGRPAINLFPFSKLPQKLQQQFPQESKKLVAIRSEYLHIREISHKDGEFTAPLEIGVVTEIRYYGGSSILQLAWQDSILSVKTYQDTSNLMGQRVHFTFDTSKLLFFDL